MVHVTIMIPTQRRLAGLAVALRSVLAQTRVDLSDLEVVVVDNDQVPSARDLVQGVCLSAPCAVHYIHEPHPGVASARNAGIKASSGALIAFLDDDEEAPTGWLAALLTAQSRYEADVVFGPVRARAPDHIINHRDYLEGFFSRRGPETSGLIDHHYGCGDSLIRRAALPDAVAPFSPDRDRTGGEDDLLFGQMRAAGARFAWEPEAWVWEDPVPERLNLAYTVSRAFAYGQGPTADCASASPPDRIGVARWMLVGIGQALVFGAIASVKWAAQAEDRAYWFDRAARGLGKTFWWGPFQKQFYGRTV